MHFRNKNRGEPAQVTAAASSPYVNARREWNERYGTYIASAHHWRLAALICGSALIASATGNAIQAAHEKVAVYYVNTDGTGKPHEIWRADTATPGPRTEQIRAALQEWVLGARTVYVDSRATKRVVDATYARTLADSAAFQTLASFHKEHNPYQRAASETVEVAMQTPVQLSDNTWQMEWTETVSNRISGKPVSQQTYDLTANIILAAPKDEAQLMANPVGLYVSQFSWPARN